MPRSFDMATDYDCSVDQVHRVLRDKKYWLARLADSGADEARLDAIDLRADGGVTVVTTQVLRAGQLPALVSQFHRGDLVIQREERWAPVLDGIANAVITGSISGAPVSVTGRGDLTPSGTSARLAFHADVAVRVPLVGGKLEKFIGNQLIELLEAEQRFTTGWIDGDR
jgi:hypothetical protein